MNPTNKMIVKMLRYYVKSIKKLHKIKYNCKNRKSQYKSTNPARWNPLKVKLFN